MRVDAENYVINDPETYRSIAQHLELCRGVVIEWTDGRGSAYAIAFCLEPLRFGTMHHGITGQEIPLCVSIVGVGAWVFDVESGTVLAPPYVAEKLNLDSSVNVTCEALAELLNGVKDALTEGRNE